MEKPTIVQQQRLIIQAVHEKIAGAEQLIDNTEARFNAIQLVKTHVDHLLNEGRWKSVIGRTIPPVISSQHTALSDFQRACLEVEEITAHLQSKLTYASGAIREEPTPIGRCMTFFLVFLLAGSSLASIGGAFWGIAGLEAGIVSGAVISIAVALIFAGSTGEFSEVRDIGDAYIKLVQRIDGVKLSHDKLIGEAHKQLLQDMGQLQKDLDSVRQQVEQTTPAWSDPIWNAWPVSVAVLPFSSLGQLTIIDARRKLTFPLLVPFTNGRPLVIKATGAAKAQAIQAIESLALRLAATVPPGKLQFTFLDPVGLGQNVAAFMHLADYDEKLVTSRAWTEPQHIEQRLADLTEHMETVIQKYLRRDYPTIEAYNEQAGEVAEPYRMLTALDFPVNFNETAARRLVSIAQNGPRCGVFSIILVDTAQKLPYGFNLADLEQGATVINWDGSRWVWEDDDFRDCELELDTPPAPERVSAILKAVGEAAVQASRVEVPFERVAPPQEQWWTASSLGGLRAPLGPAGARALQHLDLGKGTIRHVLTIGQTGSGKTNMLHVLITNLALHYSPDEVELYLVDFKKGVAFKTYAVNELPHARVIAIETEREFGLSVLQGLDAELIRRGELFRNMVVETIAEYRARAGRPLPRILLIVDEFHEFFTADDNIAIQATQYLDRLVKQGGAFGIHVMLGTQTLSAYTLPPGTLGQMAVRIAFQCSDADSRLILADDNGAARLLSRPGAGIYNAANGLVEGNSPFQVAWFPESDRIRYLTQIRDMAQQRGYRPPRPQIVFEGNAPAEVEKNRPLADLLEAPGWLPAARGLRAWLGDPIAIRDPIAAAFRRQSASNLLIVGKNEVAFQDTTAAELLPEQPEKTTQVVRGMMTTALLSLAAQTPLDSPTSGAARFIILDYTGVDSPYYDFFRDLAGTLPHQASVGRTNRRRTALLAELADEVRRRIGSVEDDDEEDRQPTEATASSPVFLFVFGLHAARDLRPDDSGMGSFGGFGGFGDEPAAPNPAQQFADILRNGPEAGVHTLVWCDSITNLNRSLDRRSLPEFAMRVAFQMSADDSSNLIDTAAANRLGPYRALYYHEDDGVLEKFRPYGLPPESWLGWAGQQLRAKAGSDPPGGRK